MKVSINQKGVHRIRKGHPWVFSSDLLERDADKAGPVDVLSPNGKLLGQALYSPKSLISLRMMTRGKNKIGTKLLHQRLDEALQLRSTLYPHASCYRLVFGESDGLPSLIVDRYDSVFVFQTLSAGMETFKQTVLDWIQEKFQARAILERNDATVREKEGLLQIRQVCYGEDPGEMEIELDGRKFLFFPLSGQKTGFFLDQRFNAQRAGHYCKGKVLDAFAYSGQFGIHAAAKADQVDCVDISEAAAVSISKSAARNNFENLRVHCENVFDFLRKQDQGQVRYDTIILDPPAFVKSRSALKSALRGYKEINLRAMRLLNPGGILVTSSCSQNLARSQFEEILQSAAYDAKRQCQVLEVLGQPADHPWLLSVPETNYLKCYILKAV